MIVDNLSNSKASVLERIRDLAVGARVEFIHCDLRDAPALERIFGSCRIEAVVHFAGLKAVGESVEKPRQYYDNNVGGTRILLGAMEQHGVRTIVFSSSATVYGKPEYLPYTESHPLRPENPYGENKLEIERMLAKSGSLRFAALRYFNPIGAHASGLIGEDPRGIPNNLLPYVAQVALGKLPKLRIFGNDYPTVDGTGVRDYIHVIDLAGGHVAALRYLQERQTSLTVNLGTGRGYSVLEVVSAFERASGVPISREIAPRRAGDIAAYWADASLAERLLNWRAQLGLDDMCRDAWRWQKENPDGYP